MLLISHKCSFEFRCLYVQACMKFNVACLAPNSWQASLCRIYFSCNYNIKYNCSAFILCSHPTTARINCYAHQLTISPKMLSWDENQLRAALALPSTYVPIVLRHKLESLLGVNTLPVCSKCVVIYFWPSVRSVSEHFTLVGEEES